MDCFKNMDVDDLAFQSSTFHSQSFDKAVNAVIIRCLIQSPVATLCRTNLDSCYVYRISSTLKNTFLPFSSKQLLINTFEIAGRSLDNEML